MLKSIPQQSWMQDANSTALMQAFSNAGVSARFVGGCVRDALLGRPINDVDIATDALPDEVIKLLEKVNIKTIPTGLQHGTITALVNHQTFEITTLRHDVETFGRHANVEFNASWEEDAARRDFTINAMSLDFEGTLYDYFGGYEDIKAGLVRFVGNPTTRLEEDYLRLLRYFRFHAYYGQGTPDPASLNACVALAKNMKALSGERIHHEILRLFKAPKPLQTIKIMADTNIFHHLFTNPVIDLNPSDIEVFDRYLELEFQHKLAVDGLSRMAALLKKHLDEKQARKLANRIVLSNQEKADWLCLIKFQIDATAPMARIENFQMMDHLGGVNFKKTLAISAAIDGQIISPDWWDYIEQKTNIPFPIQGRDILKMGFQQGPKIGGLLKATRLWWLENGFIANKAECLGYLDRLINDNSSN